MKHIPHLLVGGPWESPTLDVSDDQWHHLTRALRTGVGETVSYTNGLGVVGTGVLVDRGIERGEEESVERPSEITVAVAPPSKKDRQRFLVEKLAELGVARLFWLETRHGQNRVAKSAKVAAWAQSGLEQSQGAHLMETSGDLVPPGDLGGRVVVCQPGGGPQPDEFDVVVVGPEGGFADSDIPEDAGLWDLGPTVLRVETAALVAVARLTAS